MTSNPVRCTCDRFTADRVTVYCDCCRSGGSNGHPICTTLGDGKTWWGCEHAEVLRLQHPEQPALGGCMTTPVWAVWYNEDDIRQIAYDLTISFAAARSLYVTAIVAGAQTPESCIAAAKAGATVLINAQEEEQRSQS